MRIRITQTGFERFTGAFGIVQFVDGVSVTDVAPHEVDRLAAAIQIVEEAGDAPGRALGPAAAIVGGVTLRADVVRPLLTAEAAGVAITTKDAPAPADAAPRPAAAETRRVYSETELAAIADREGIRGLRAIASGRGVTAKSITDLIAGILKEQEAFAQTNGLTGPRVLEAKGETAPLPGPRATVTPAQTPAQTPEETMPAADAADAAAGAQGE
ncbi:hypothetical protein [Azospirillum argentinense]|uniref:hypothetical protein n=1 Tax=Azospirillum argentinense TaxID=2970906 RepID=UPI0032DFDFE8